MPRVERKPEAVADLVEIGERIAEGSQRAANRFMEAAEKAAELLAEFPDLVGISESENPALHGVRLWPIKRFRRSLILYRPLEDGIEVVRVVYGSHDLETLFGS